MKVTIKDRKILKDKAWDTYSIYIRKRDSGKCITCDKRIWDEEIGEWTIKGMQAGHFFHGVLDFDEDNVNCQCQQCNHFKSGNGAIYSVKLIEKIGKERFDELNKKRLVALKGELKSAEEYEEIIRKYTEKTNELGKQDIVH